MVARGLLSTLDSISTPCSVKAIGRYFECPPCFKVPNWLLKIRYSSLVNSNMLLKPIIWTVLWPMARKRAIERLLSPYAFHWIIRCTDNPYIESFCNHPYLRSGCLTNFKYITFSLQSHTQSVCAQVGQGLPVAPGAGRCAQRSGRP